MRMSHKSLSTVLGILAVGIALPAQTSNSPDAVVFTLNEEFASDPRLHDIRIEISDGYVHLRGTVTLLEDARQVVKKAYEKGAPSGLISHIVVRTPEVSDASLRLELREKLSRLRLDSVRLRIRHGIVRISGNMPEEKQRESILTAVCSTPGVRGVDDLLQVKGAVYEPSKKSVH